MSTQEPPPRWGKQTQLAIENFPVSGERIPPAIIRALAMIKAECAAVNGQLGTVPAPVAEAIRAAADEVAGGQLADQFPVDIFQTGSGTSTNMNMNEVLANRATEILRSAQQPASPDQDVHPNDHVNASQSSNDTFPSAARVAAATRITDALLPSLRDLQRSLIELATRHAGTVKMGRTHLMDAVPMTFGQEVGGWARTIELAVERLTGCLTRLGELPLGGTAVGTGLNAPAEFGALVAARLTARTGVAFIEATDHFEAQASQDALTEAAAVLKVVAVGLNKIAGDLRLLSSGPNGGLGEIVLPALQAGSSIMPGKVNPVIPEMVQQVAAQVVGNDATATFAATMSTLQINTAMPVIACSVLSSVDLLSNAITLLDTRCVRGIEINAVRMRTNAARSPAIVTALAPRIGYDEAARLVRQADEEGVSLAELLERSGDWTPESLDQALLEMARPAATDDTRGSGV
ncbi:MAG TPA: class II fumarate hydratase [Ilumatobacteraceae bacterium]|jgi:fumarate hydratase class II